MLQLPAQLSRLWTSPNIMSGARKLETMFLCCNQRLGILRIVGNGGPLLPLLHRSPRWRELPLKAKALVAMHLPWSIAGHLCRSFQDIDGEFLPVAVPKCMREHTFIVCLASVWYCRPSSRLEEQNPHQDGARNGLGPPPQRG